MKPTLSTVILLALAPLFAPAVQADKTSTVLLNAVTVTGPSSAIYSAVSPAETGAENWFFQVHRTGDAVVARLELSNDGGTTWSTLVVFNQGRDFMVVRPACGACRFRIYVVEASAGDAVSVWVTQSGVLVPVVEP